MLFNNVLDFILENTCSSVITTCVITPSAPILNVHIYIYIYLYCLLSSFESMEDLLFFDPYFLPSSVLLPFAAKNTGDTLSFTALIVDGRTHFDRGPFGLGRGDSCFKNLYKLIFALVLVGAFALVHVLCALMNKLHDAAT